MSVPIQRVALLVPKEEVDKELAKGERVFQLGENFSEGGVAPLHKQKSQAKIKDIWVTALPSYKISTYFGRVTLGIIKVIRGFINAFL